MFGNLVISYRVVIPARDLGYGERDPNGTRVKRATLANIPCNYSIRDDVLSEFKEKNPSLNSREICAEFRFVEYL